MDISLVEKIVGKKDATKIAIYTNNWRSIEEMTSKNLSIGAGISLKNAEKILCAIKIGKEWASESLSRGVVVDSCKKIYEFFFPLLRGERREHFFSVLLDTKNGIISVNQVAIGSQTTAICHPREVFRTAVAQAAVKIVLVHNHPSGMVDPSPEDHHITKRMVETGKIVGIEVADHVIIGEGKYYSFLEEGVMPR